MDRLAARLHISPEFLKFLLVGGVTFVINLAAFELLYDVLPVLPAHKTDFDFVLITHPDIRLLLASALAVEVAIVFKFFALENWTFRDRPRRGWGPVRFLRLNATSIVGQIITVATVNVLTPVFGISPYISLSIGVMLGFLANWLFSAYLIWPSARSEASAA
ncbi:MAG: GtrA family protein [Chloroflexi bacterium]|nr:GtrA family protein [Chloroflexota bacterium]